MAPLFLLTLGLLLAPALAVPVPAPSTTPTPRTLNPTCLNKEDDGKAFVADNVHWKIECDTDYWGGDIAASTLDTFEKCIKACDALTGCVSVQYVGDQCYQKGSIAAESTPQQNCWTARLFKEGEEILEVPTYSCVDNKDNGKVYTTSKGPFEIVCGKDFGGNDISAVNVESFELCMDACAATTGCVNAAYVWGACYLKSKSGPTSDAAHVWSAKLQESTTNSDLSCVDNKDNNRDFTTPHGTYHIQCGTDFPGNDMKTAAVSTFEACISECSLTTGCTTVAFVRDTCYLKSKKGDGVALGHVWGASLVGAIETPTAPDTSLSCLNKKDDAKVYNAPSGGHYLIQCGLDYAGGDFAASGVASFEACIAACDAEATQCVDVSYVNGQCYLKSSVISPALELDHVWTAKLIVAGTSASSSSSSSSSASSSTTSTTSSTTTTTTTTTSATPTTTSTTTTTTTTTTTSATPTPTNLSCPSATGYTYSDATNDWEVRCNIDYPYNDLATNNSPTFETCIASCSSRTGCVGVTWVTTGPSAALTAQGSVSCVLKSAIGAARPASLPWIGPPLATAILKSPFKIHSVVYSTLNITTEATQAWMQGTKIVVDTNEALWHLRGDPWINTRKSVSMLYSYRSELRVFNGYDYGGVITILPGPVSNHIGSTVVPDWPVSGGVTGIKIVAANWGIGQVTVASSIANMYLSYAAATKWLWNTSKMGSDNWPGITKSGVIWYRDTTRNTLYYITGRDSTESAWVVPS